ncbi:MAG: sensor histidine kinase [Candidatus Binatia bacterium]
MEELHHGFTPARNGQRRQPSAIRPAATKEAIGRLVAELGLARENERQKIANELHDRIAQNLALAKMKLALLKTSLPRKQMLMVRGIHKLIGEVIDETRSLMCDLYPQRIDDLGLRAALEWLVQRTRVNYGLACVAELESMPSQLPPEIEDTIFQALRELLINVAKHARAKQVRVIIRAEEHRMIVEVVDDGNGFKPTLPSPLDPRRGGFGLLCIRERLSRIGGSMHVDSAPGEGTRVLVTCPINTRREGRQCRVAS